MSRLEGFPDGGGMEGVDCENCARGNPGFVVSSFTGNAGTGWLGNHE
jgi:hypothetical protein